RSVHKLRSCVFDELAVGLGGVSLHDLTAGGEHQRILGAVTELFSRRGGIGDAQRERLAEQRLQLTPTCRVGGEAVVRRHTRVVRGEALLQHVRQQVVTHRCPRLSSGYFGAMSTWRRCMPLCWSTLTLFSFLPSAFAVSATERPEAKRRMITSR